MSYTYSKFRKRNRVSDKEKDTHIKIERARLYKVRTYELE